jgi:capsid protein
MVKTLKQGIKMQTATVNRKNWALSLWEKLTTSNEPKQSYDNGHLISTFSLSYNGEKNLGEAGPIRDYRPDYYLLSLRSWQAYTESEIAQTIINKYVTWVIGKGLKLQAEPLKLVLESEGVKLPEDKTSKKTIANNFSNITEARFNCFQKSKNADYSKQKSLKRIAKTAYKNAVIGGDLLVVLRYIKGQTTVQLIDGCHVQSPLYGTEYYPQDLPNGNKIINGIEVNSEGQHVRYWIKQRDLSFISFDAVGKRSGLTQAFMVYGLEHRMYNNRGVPYLSVVIETLKKLERYKEATVGSAEERQKIAFTIEHDHTSTGENPFAKNLAKAFKVDGNEDIPTDINGTQLSDLVAATTNKQAVNMPVGAKVKMHESKNELYFKDFYSVNSDIMCAAIGIPPEVAMSKYDSNFSASRAALKDWEHTLSVRRDEFSEAFYQNIYNFWLDIEILNNKIQAPGYIEARLNNNQTVLEAYRNARFIGATVPHIDPLKEVNAERAKLGEAGALLPLTTFEQATEALNTGDSYENIKQFAEEILDMKKLKIENQQQPAPQKTPVEQKVDRLEKAINALIEMVSETRV